MALRTILTEGDPTLRKICRPVTKFDERLETLLDDMLETMYAAPGVGLAAPQVGILRRAVVIDCGDGPLKMVNPVIVEKEGSQSWVEGLPVRARQAGQNAPARTGTGSLSGRQGAGL